MAQKTQYQQWKPQSCQLLFVHLTFFIHSALRHIDTIGTAVQRSTTRHLLRRNLTMRRVPSVGEEYAVDILETLLARLGNHLASSSVENLVVGCVFFLRIPSFSQRFSGQSIILTHSTTTRRFVAMTPPSVSHLPPTNIAVIPNATRRGSTTR